VTLRDDIIKTIKEEFPNAEFEVHERRDTILEIRATLQKDVFVEVYANFLTSKRSYTLIYKGDRIFGYDNYKFWHYHPLKDPNIHISCEEPSVSFVIQQIRETIEIWRQYREGSNFGG